MEAEQTALFWLPTSHGGSIAAGASCSTCPFGKSHIVKGLTGNTDSPTLMIVTDKPASKHGAFTVEPTPGRKKWTTAGQILIDLLAQEGFDLTDVAVTSDVCCKPPGASRMPKKIYDFCTSRLLNEIKEVNPKVVLLLGQEATLSALGPSTANFSRRRGIPKNGMIPTWHPNAVFGDPDLLWPDMQQDVHLACRIARGEEVTVEPPYDDYQKVMSLDDLDKALVDLAEASKVAIDLETDGFDFLEGQIRLLGLSWGVGHAVVIPWSLLETNPDRMEVLGKILNRVECVFQNGQFDVPWLEHRGIHPNFAFDTLLAHFLLDERRTGHNLQAMAVKYCDAPDWKTQLGDRFGPGAYATIPFEDLVRYNGADVDYTYRLSEIFEEQLDEQGLGFANYNILVPAARHFTKLRMHGMLIHQERLESLGDDLREEISVLEARLRSFPGAGSLNFKSPSQLAEYLYDFLHLRPFGDCVPGKWFIAEKTVLAAIRSVDDPEAQEFWRSKRGLQKHDLGFDPRSTEAYTLWWLAQQHEFPRTLLAYRKKIKQLDSYYERIKNNLWPDGRVRPVYRLWGAKTGRISSVDPAIHNLPRDDRIWDLFIPDPGHVIVYADYSQVELRIAAHMSQEKELIRMLNEGDVHAEVAKKMFNCYGADWDALPADVRKERRTAAKGVNFGVLYGRTAKGLAPQLGVTLEEAEQYIHAYYEGLPQLAQWIEKQKRLLRADREVRSLFGRKRRFPIALSETHMRELERQATNMPVQSTASDVTLLAHMRVVEKLENLGVDVKVWPHIHDSMSITVPEEFKDLAIETVIETMLDVPFKSDVVFDCEVKWGYSWGSMTKVRG
jgi:DNA polymerase-1